MTLTKAPSDPMVTRGIVGDVGTLNGRCRLSVFDLYSPAEPDTVIATVYTNYKVTDWRKGKLVDVWVAEGEDPNAGEFMASGIKTVRGYC